MASDSKNMKKNKLPDLLQRTKSTNQLGTGGSKLPSSRQMSLKGSKSNSKSPKLKTKLSSKRFNLFRSHKEPTTLTPSQEVDSKTDSLKENAKRTGTGKNKTVLNEEEKPPFPTKKSPQLNFRSSEKRDKSLSEKVLQAIIEKHTPQKKKTIPVLKEPSPKHVLYTTFEDKNFKSLLKSEENLTVVPWKSGKSIPTSTGRTITTQVSYCNSCGNVADKTKVRGSEDTKSETKKLETTPKVRKLLKNVDTVYNSYPRASKKSQKLSPESAEKRLRFEGVDSKSLPRKNHKDIGSKSAVIQELKKELSNRENQETSEVFTKEEEEKKPQVPKRHASLVRSLSDPTSSPRKDQKPRVLHQYKRKICEARIKQTYSVNQKLKPRHRSVGCEEEDSDIDIKDLDLWKREIKNSAPNFGDTNSEEFQSKMLASKLKNGHIEHYYPLLKTKIPEEYIQEDGSVTLRSGEGVKKAEADRDSGVDVDNNTCKSPLNDSDNESTVTPDSALESSNETDLKQEFDFDTLKKSHNRTTTTEKSSNESLDDEGTLKRHSSTSKDIEEDKEDWDMYALLKRFECVEWDLSPASNLKRQTLDLDGCNLDCVPAAVTEIEYYAFRDVEAVSLNHNTKIENADVLGKLADLRVINMWGCNLKAIPPTWSRLTKLQMLGLGNNKDLTIFGPLKHLTNLVWLDLGGCGLKFIPDEVTNMMKLKVLALGGNPGIEIGDEICSLWDLKKLGLNDCELEEIPKSVFSLTKLTHLHVDNNYICHIGQEIVQLTELEELTVTGNSNIVFPKILSQCDTIKCIVIDKSKDLTRVSGTLKNRMRQVQTARSPAKTQEAQSKNTSVS